MPQFCIQVAYIFLIDESELSPIVFFSMIFSILSLMFSIGRQGRIFCEWFNPPDVRFNNHFTSNVEMIIECDDLKWEHSFANSKIQECISKVLYTCNDLGSYCNDDTRSDIKTEIEVYYIKNNITVSATKSKNIVVHFMVDVYFMTSNLTQWKSIQNLLQLFIMNI